MVNSFTSNQIGDSFIAKLRESYSNIVQVSDWTIIAGVSNPTTVGKLRFLTGSQNVTGISTNLNFQTGDKFIIGNLTFRVNQIIDSNNFTVDQVLDATGVEIDTTSPITGDFIFYLPEDLNNYFTFQYRWSQSESIDGGQFSEFSELNKNTNAGDLLAKTFDDTKPLWIDVRAEVERLSSGSSISLLSITFELQTTDGQIISCPNWCEECTDPYAMDGCANIVIDCSDPIWNPYNLKKPTSVYRQLSSLANNMWGHEVQYFRVEPDNRSRDVILMEYSLYNVVDEANIKVLVPDNAFPTREFNFDIFGMDFEEFEIHVLGEAFTSVFGLNKTPNSRDYLYFPIINRMYEVSSVALADEFNLTMTYWRVQLRKYEERTSSIHTDTVIEQHVDDLVTGIEEVFGEEIEQEVQKVTKPQQFKTVYQELDDSIRFSKHPTLQIQDAEIRNRWTLISKNNYQLNQVESGERFALTYNAKSQLAESNNLALTGWIRPQFKTADTEKYVFFDGRSELDLSNGLSLAISQTEIEVSINGQINTFTLPNQLEFNVWYGYVLNINNTSNQVGIHLYRLDPDSNKTLPHQKTGTFSNFTTELINLLSPVSWDAGKGWSLSASPINMTNIRVFKKVIEDEQHMNVLQQYVVRDSDLSIITDNAIPSIRLRQYSNPR